VLVQSKVKAVGLIGQTTAQKVVTLLGINMVLAALTLKLITAGIAQDVVAQAMLQLMMVAMMQAMMAAMTHVII